jgi:hypothetical protein
MRYEDIRYNQIENDWPLSSRHGMTRPPIETALLSPNFSNNHSLASGGPITGYLEHHHTSPDTNPTDTDADIKLDDDSDDESDEANTEDYRFRRGRQ